MLAVSQKKACVSMVPAPLADMDAYVIDRLCQPIADAAFYRWNLSPASLAKLCAFAASLIALWAQTLTSYEGVARWPGQFFGFWTGTILAIACFSIILQINYAGRRGERYIAAEFRYDPVHCLTRITFTIVFLIGLLTVPAYTLRILLKGSSSPLSELVLLWYIGLFAGALFFAACRQPPIKLRRRALAFA